MSRSLLHERFDKGILGTGHGHGILVSQRFGGRSPVTEDERAAAVGELADPDAEHERRRATGRRNAGEAA